MICPACNAANRVGAAFCADCGGRLPVGGPANRTGLAVTALVLGILSVLSIYALELSMLLGLTAAACGAIAFVQAKRQPLQFAGKSLALAGAGIGGMVALLYPVWASLVVPTRLKAAITANETAAVRDVNAVVAAERRYALANHDYYDTFGCLARPQDCIPGYRANLTIIDAPLVATSVRHGYSYTLALGPSAPAEAAESTSPSSVTCFAYIAAPVKVGVTGSRAFCGDESGQVRVGLSGVEPEVRDGRCPQAWPLLE